MLTFGASVNFSFLNSQFRCDLDLGTQKPLSSDLNFDIPLKYADIFSNIHISCVLINKSTTCMIKCVAGRTAPFV